MDERTPPRATATKPAGKPPPPIFEAGRACPTCGTPLSRYNPGPACHLHRPFKQPRVRGAR